MRRAVTTTATLAMAWLLFAGCTATALPTPSGSPPPAPSIEPTPSATVEPRADASAAPPEAPTSSPVDPVPLPNNTYARVVTNDLRVRSKPGVSDDSEKLEPLLQDGLRVVVLDGPVQASGFDWYYVLPVSVTDTSDDPGYPFGWVAAGGKDGEPWLESEAPNCRPAPPTFTALMDLYGIWTSYDALTCLSGQEISFEARVGQPEARCGTAMPWGVEPTWFDPCLADETYLVPVEGMDGEPMLTPAWAPDVDTSIAGPPNAAFHDMPVVQVTGMFDHPTARTCRNRLDHEDPEFTEPDPAVTILTCRWTFVVTSMQEVEG